MKVAQIVPFFPNPTETGILTEMLGLDRLGAEQAIFSFRPFAPTPGVPRAQPLLARVRYLDASWTHGRLVDGALNLATCIPGMLRHGLRMRRLLLANVLRPMRWRRAVRLIQMIRRERAALVHVHFGHVAAWTAPVLASQGVPLIVSFRGQDVMLVQREPERVREQLFAQAVQVLVRCESMARDVAALGCPANKIEVHYSPVDVDSLPFAERSAPSPAEKIVVLMVGRLVEKKGVGIALRAVRQCLHAHEGLLLRIIGDGPLARALREQANSLGLGEKVAFLGAQPNERVIEEMGKAHIFLCASHTASDGDKEGIPNALKEAMGCGLPVVATRHAGIPECVEDGVSGLLAPERDPEGLVRQLTRMINQPGAWPGMGRAGRRIIEEVFAVELLSARLLSQYQRWTG